MDLEHKRTRPFVFQINRKMVNTIWFRVDLIRFGKYFSVCTRVSGGAKTPQPDCFRHEVPISCVHTLKVTSDSCVKSTQIRLCFHWFLTESTEFCLVDNQSGNGKYNLISGLFNKNQKWIFSGVHTVPMDLCILSN